jgi:hypothetical protein
MKVTLVIDSEDEEGIVDTLKIVNHFYRKYGSGGHKSGYTVKYGKIALIKMLRQYSRHCLDAHKEGDDPNSLRFAKDFAENQFDEQRNKDLTRL